MPVSHSRQCSRACMDYNHNTHNTQETPFTLWDAITNDPQMSAHSRMWAQLPCRTPHKLALNMRVNLTMFFSRPLAHMAAPQWDSMPGAAEQHALWQFVTSTTTGVFLVVVDAQCLIAKCAVYGCCTKQMMVLWMFFCILLLYTHGAPNPSGLSSQA